jgi:hypothetical protein
MHRIMLAHYRPLICLACVGLAVTLGCREEPKITSYQAPKLSSTGLASAAVETAPQRMLAAIVPVAENAWFLKVTGDAAAVEQIRDPFRAVALSLQFGDDGKPSWTLPDGWQERPGDGVRYRTIRIDAEPPLDLSVTSLPFQGELDGYLLANINRWRGQLNLDNITDSDLEKSVEKVETRGKVSVYLVDIKGRGVARQNAVGPGADAEKLSLDAPPEWQPGKLNAMRRAAYEVTDGSQKAETTVTVLSGAAGGAGNVLANVNRWRGQVDLPEIDEQQLQKESRQLEIAGIESTYVALHGRQQSSILGVIIPRESDIWFIKMTGDTPLVEREQERFEKFAQSLKFE